MAKKKVTKKKATKKKATTLPVSTTIADCQFVGVKFDGEAVAAVSRIADGLVRNADALAQNAEALQQLCYILKASNISIGPMLQVNDPRQVTGSNLRARDSDIGKP